MGEKNRKNFPFFHKFFSRSISFNFLEAVSQHLIDYQNAPLPNKTVIIQVVLDATLLHSLPILELTRQASIFYVVNGRPFSNWSREVTAHEGYIEIKAGL